MKIMIVGHARHGKDTVADYIAANFGLKHTSSSMWAAKNIMMDVMAKQGVFYPDVQACFDDRTNYRSVWYDAITEYCKDNGARLIQEIFAEHDIYVGCRNFREFCRAKNSGAFNISIFVDRPDSADEAASSMSIPRWAADYTIINDGTLAQLEKQTVELVERVMGPAWKVVNTDNFGGDYPDEKFVGDVFYDHQLACGYKDALNKPMHENHPRYHKVVRLPYKLIPGFQP